MAGNIAYSDEIKRQVVSSYLVHGRGTLVSRECGIPETTISTWKNEPWWDDLAADVRIEVADEISSDITRYLRESLKQVGERLENGDEHVLRDGSIIRAKVKMRDLAVTSAVLFDKRRLLMGQATSIRGKEGLGGLAARMAQMRDVTPQAIESTAQRIEE